MNYKKKKISIRIYIIKKGQISEIKKGNKDKK